MNKRNGKGKGVKVRQHPCFSLHIFGNAHRIKHSSRHLIVGYLLAAEWQQERARAVLLRTGGFCTPLVYCISNGASRKIKIAVSLRMGEKRERKERKKKGERNKEERLR